MMKLNDMLMSPYMDALEGRIAALRGQQQEPSPGFRLPMTPYGGGLPTQQLGGAGGLRTAPGTFTPGGAGGISLNQAPPLTRPPMLPPAYGGNPYAGLLPRFRRLWGLGTPTVPAPVRQAPQNTYGWGGTLL